MACRSVFGLAATEANLRTRALHKPVLQVSYELAAPPQFRGQPREAAQWQQPLTDLLGAPAEAQAYTEPGRTDKGGRCKWVCQYLGAGGSRRAGRSTR